MSLAILLEEVRNHLRTQLSLTATHCGIQMDGQPPPRSAEFYVALDEGGVEAMGGEEAYALERYAISVHIWRRAGQHPLDRSGDLLERTDGTKQTLEKLERPIIKALHGNWSLVSTINTNQALPDATLGDVFQLPLFYRGRGKTNVETTEYHDPDRLTAWYTRVLSFSGMDRLQDIASIG